MSYIQIISEAVYVHVPTFKPATVPKNQLANHHVHVSTSKVRTWITVFFLNAAADSRASSKVGAEEKQADKLRTTWTAKDTPSKLVRTGIKILRNTVSDVLSFAYYSSQTAEGIKIKFFCFDCCVLELKQFKYYCFLQSNWKNFLGCLLGSFFCPQTTIILRCCGMLYIDVECKFLRQMTSEIFMRHLTQSSQMQQLLSVFTTKSVHLAQNRWHAQTVLTIHN